LTVVVGLGAHGCAEGLDIGIIEKLSAAVLVIVRVALN
jgi:hypothetical protein